MKDLLRIMKYLKPYLSSLEGAFVLLLLSTGMNLFQPRLSQWAIDYGIDSGRISQVLLMAGGIFLSAALASFINYKSGVMLIQSAQGMSYDLRNDLYKKVSSFSFSNFDRWRTGELMVRCNSDVNTIRMFMRMGLFMLAQSILMIIGSLAAMYTTNTAMANLLACIMAGTLVFFFFIARFIRPIFIKMREFLDKLNNVLQENLAGAKLVRAFSQQKSEEEKFGKRNADYLKISVKAGYLLGVLIPLLFLIGNGALLAANWRGGIQVITGTETSGLTLGELVAFNNYAMMAVFPLLMLAMVLNFTAMAVASSKRVAELLDEESDIQEKAEPLILPKLSGKIEYRDVCFRYGHGENALDHISLVIQAGERIGIIGTTGSGKSSLVNLITRNYDVCGGTVFIDDQDVRDYSFKTIRSRITLVLQETILFSGTLEENVRFGRPDADFAEVRGAAEAACSLDFIEKKEKKWQESIGERGSGLSGGQRQRIALARALLSQPDILILDDITSALDLETESRIIENIYSRKEPMTTIIISQKINAVKRADRIIVMDKGKIIGTGDHESLLKDNNLYQKIDTTQRALA